MQKVVRTNKTTKKTQIANSSTRKKKNTQTANDDVPYQAARHQGRAAGRQQRRKLCRGALLGTGLGLVIGNNH